MQIKRGVSTRLLREQKKSRIFYNAALYKRTMSSGSFEILKYYQCPDCNHQAKAHGPAPCSECSESHPCMHKYKQVIDAAIAELKEAKAHV